MKNKENRIRAKQNTIEWLQSELNNKEIEQNKLAEEIKQISKTLEKEARILVKLKKQGYIGYTIDTVKLKVMQIFKKEDEHPTFI